MFKLYFFVSKSPYLVFQSEDLAPCLDYINNKQYEKQLCVIISPNNRKISFVNDELVFGAAVA
jgi:hypothetical protein